MWCKTPDEYTTSNDAGRSPGSMQIDFDECTRSSPNRRAADAASRNDSRDRSAPMTIRSRAREIKAHLARAASDLDDSRVEGDRAVEQARELAAAGPRAQPDELVVRRVTGKRRLLVETPHDVDARLTREAQSGNAIRCAIARAAAPARPVRRQVGLARGTRHQRAEVVIVEWATAIMESTGTLTRSNR